MYDLLYYYFLYDYLIDNEKDQDDTHNPTEPPDPPNTDIDILGGVDNSDNDTPHR